MHDLTRLSACEAVAALRDRRVTAVEVTSAHLKRIAEREQDVRAWSFLDPELALVRAVEADRKIAAGDLVGCLHGLPIGIKDVFDTSDMPSEYGSPLFRGRRPGSDAAAVSVLRRAGAVLVGKTETSEFGMYQQSRTRNPHDTARSAGVSSSGSAAAVVDFMVPLALGTQHTASTLLPASFCGAVGFKPSFGFTDMRGSNILARRLANIGLLGRSVQDIALFAGAYDPTMSQLDALRTPPALALAGGPGWERADRDSIERLIALHEALGVGVDAVRWPDEFNTAVDLCIELLNVNLAERFGSMTEDELCEPLRLAVASGRQIGLGRRAQLNGAADRLAAIADGALANWDALVSLSAPGEATLIEEGPGSGALCMPWSLCGLPTVSLPLLSGPDGLPIGVQLIGRRGRDRRLLEIAHWLTMAVSSSTATQNE